MIYIFVIFLTTLFSFFFEISRKNEKVFSEVMFSLSVIFPAVVGGCRDVGVGTDTSIYGEPFFDMAKECNDIFSFFLLSSSEMGYGLLNYSVAQTFTSVNSLFFILQLITLLLFFVSFRKFSKVGTSYTLSVFLFMCFFYNFSFNIMRQVIAMGIILYAEIVLWEKKEKKFWIVSGIATLFHSSAILGAALVYVINYMSSYGFIKARKYIVLIIIAFVAFFVLYMPVVQFVSSISLFSKYITYVDGYEMDMNQGVSYTNLLFRFIMLAFSIYVYNFCSKIPAKVRIFYLLVCAIESLSYLLSFKTTYAYRLGLYMSVSHLLFLPVITVKNKHLIYFIIPFYIFYFAYAILYNNENGTVPYSSKILNV